MLLTLLCTFVYGEVFAQSRTITGKVTSKDDGTGLPGVTVKVKGGTVGTQTDVDGSYKLDLPQDAQSLEFSFVGYATQTITIGNQSVIDVKLATDDTELGEVVVVGYGTQNKKELTGSIGSVNTKELQNVPLTSIDQTLQGRVAGVLTTQNSGTPGGGITIRVRGTGSITGSSEPLYVVDGVPINTGDYSRTGVGNQGTNALADLNPSDIQSMEVLKDAAAAAIYGSRASNGVVLITTKRGSAGKTKINFGYYTGFQEAWKKLGVITGQQYVDLIKEQTVNRFGAGVLPSALGLQGLDGNATASTNWQNEIFRTSSISQYDLSMSGGNESTKFMVSGTYFKNDGIVLGSTFDRMNARVNLDHNLSKKIKVGANLGLTRSTQNRLNNDNNIYGVVSTAILMGPHIPVKNASGAYAKDPNSSTENPVAAANLPTQLYITNRIIGNVYAEYEVIKGLSLRTSFGTDFQAIKEDNFYPSTLNQGAPRGLGRSNYIQDAMWLNENTLNYRKTFADKHNLNVLLGTSIQESVYERIEATASDFPSDDLPRLESGAVKTVANSFGTSWGLVGYFARLNYDYAGKYILGFSVRTDGSSRFGTNKQFGTFPSVSAAWRISEEAFLKNVSWLSDLKLRGSWGLTGNQEIGNFTSRGLWGSGVGNRANYNAIAGLTPTQMENRDLSWEKSTAINGGIEAGFLNGRFNLSVDYFVRDVSDLLLNRQLPLTSGFNTISANIGGIRNSGLEASITTTNVRTKDFTWTTNFNVAVIRNEVTALYNNQAFAAGFASWVQVGQPLGAFRGFRVDRIFQTQEEINTLNAEARAKSGNPAAFYQTNLTAPGDIKFKDLNGDGRITADDQEVLGNAQPDYYGGLTNTLSYKGLELMFFFQFNQGNKIYNNTRAFSEGMNSVFGSTDGVLRRWTPTNTNTDVPRAVFNDPNQNRRVSDRWLEDGSFIRLKNISLSYSLPTSIIEKVKLRSVRVYVSGQNLLTITNYKGFDPEVSTFNATNTSPGTDFLTFPQARTYTFGFNIGI